MKNSALHTGSIPICDLHESAEVGHLFVILDACDAPLVPRKVSELNPERAVSLYRGVEEEEYWAVAPYLVQADASLLDWILADLWREPWGIFAIADVDLQALRRHFRQFLVVKDPEGEQMYFRFYDPRVLSAFLPTCNESEMTRFFGPCQSLGLGWGSASERITSYRPVVAGRA